jgi:hypothetical protein
MRVACYEILAATSTLSTVNPNTAFVHRTIGIQAYPTWIRRFPLGLISHPCLELSLALILSRGDPGFSSGFAILSLRSS